ncbi:hypothetical protein [Sphingomonas sp. GC_Shp_4]|nr:hypothetical protein [Sphingomonas sp. GC_Shp_4]
MVRLTAKESVDGNAHRLDSFRRDNMRVGCPGEQALPQSTTTAHAMGLTGEVNWSAPRRLALASMPTVAIAVLGFQTFLSVSVALKPGQEGLVLPMLVGTGATLIVVQLLHFWLIEKTLRRHVEYFIGDLMRGILSTIVDRASRRGCLQRLRIFLQQIVA